MRARADPVADRMGGLPGIARIGDARPDAPVELGEAHSGPREGDRIVVDDRQPLEQLTGVYGDAVAFARPGASLAEVDRRVRAGIADAGYPGQPSHPICHGVGARAHEPPYAHQAGGGEIREGMVLAIEPGIYWPEGGGLRLEDNYLVTVDGCEKLSPFPDGIVVV